MCLWSCRWKQDQPCSIDDDFDEAGQKAQKWNRFKLPNLAGQADATDSNREKPEKIQETPILDSFCVDSWFVRAGIIRRGSRVAARTNTMVQLSCKYGRLRTTTSKDAALLIDLCFRY